MHILRRGTAALIAVGAAGTLAVAAPAGASAPRISAQAPAGARPASAQQSSVDSNAFAGYQVTEPGIARASVTFQVPTVSGCASAVQGQAYGLGNEQVVGTPTILGIAFAACNGPSPLYEIQAIAGGVSQVGSANPGDVITVTLSETQSSALVVVKDRTSGISVRAKGSSVDQALLFGAFPLFQGTTDPLPLAAVPPVRLQRATFENAYLNLWPTTRIVRTNGTTTSMSTGALGTTGGFTLRFLTN